MGSFTHLVQPTVADLQRLLEILACHEGRHLQVKVLITTLVSYCENGVTIVVLHGIVAVAHFRDEGVGSNLATYMHPGIIIVSQSLTIEDTLVYLFQQA